MSTGLAVAPATRDRWPWTGESIPLPSRVGGRRVLAAIRLPNPAESTSRWTAVIESPGDTFTLAAVVYRDAGFRATYSAPGYSYPEAVLAMVDQYITQSSVL